MGFETTFDMKEKMRIQIFPEYISSFCHWKNESSDSCIEDLGPRKGVEELHSTTTPDLMILENGFWLDSSDLGIHDTFPVGRQMKINEENENKNAADVARRQWFMGMGKVVPCCLTRCQVMIRANWSKFLWRPSGDLLHI